MSFLPPSFTSPTTVAAMQNAATTTGSDYKCMVAIYMYGANDSANTVIPYGTNPNRVHYEGARPLGVRISQEEIDEAGSVLSGTNPQWALHPILTGLLSQWDNGNLAIVRDVGILNKPTTKSQYLSDPSFTPLGLFAHNIQQDAWNAGLPFNTPRVTGWFGRWANLTDDYFNPDTEVGAGAISTLGINLQLFAYPPKICPSYPPFNFPLGDSFGTVQEEYEAVIDSIGQTKQFNSPFLSLIPVQLNNINTALREVFKNNILTQNALTEDGGGWDPSTPIGSELTSIFNLARAEADSTILQIPSPTDPSTLVNRALSQKQFVGTMENVAKLIYSRNTLSQRRQAIYAGLGALDNHNFLRLTHEQVIKTFDIALTAFWAAIDVMDEETPGLKDSVVVFTESDFGRTLRSNGTFGTDHAWSGHHFVMGPSVIGGMYGTEPDYTLGGDRDVYTSAETSLGRFIPQISTEQYYATILKWMDIPEDLIELIVPALPLYSQKDIGFLP